MKKKKVKSTNTNARDVHYIADMGDDSEGDYEEIDTRVEVSKKQHRPQFIAPLSMNKVANLAKKHRTIAPNMPDMCPLGSSAIKDDQSKSKVTMGELVLNNKGTQRQKVVFKQNVAKPTCITRGAKRRLFLVDDDVDNADADDDDDETSQDVDGTNSEEDGLKDNEIEGDIMRSHDDGYGDMVHMDDDSDDNLENEIQGDDSDDNLENGDDVFLREQLKDSNLDKASDF